MIGFSLGESVGLELAQCGSQIRSLLMQLLHNVIYEAPLKKCMIGVLLIAQFQKDAEVDTQILESAA